MSRSGGARNRALSRVVLVSALAVLASAHAGAQPPGLAATARGPGRSSAGRCPDLPFRFVTAGATLTAPAGFDALAVVDVQRREALLRPPLSAGAWTVSADAYEQVRALKATDSLEHPAIVLAWSRAGEAAAPARCVQRFDTARSVVGAVLCPDLENRRSCVQGLGGQLVVEAWDLDDWLGTVARSDSRPVAERRSDLVLFLDGMPLPGVHPDNPNTQAAYWNRGHKVTRLQFTLARSDANRSAWTRLLHGYQWEPRSTQVSVGLLTGEVMPSDVGPLSGHAEPYRRFHLSIVPHGQAIFALIGFALAVVLFGVLAAKTTILRDTAAANRPDGKSPLSLARAQMAFWFFLVAASYVFLFLVTRDANTLTPSVLVLIGISAATAVGSAMIGQDPAQDRNFNRPKLSDPTDDHGAIQELKRHALRQQEELSTAPADEVSKRQDQLDLTDRQIRFFGRRAFNRGLFDLLGDDGNISFHRFQIAVWTLVLGVVFLMRVYEELAMPDFSTTLLGLMGISSGAYVGYKLAPTRPATAGSHP